MPFDPTYSATLLESSPNHALSYPAVALSPNGSPRPILPWIPCAPCGAAPSMALEASLNHPASALLQGYRSPRVSPRFLPDCSRARIHARIAQRFSGAWPGRPRAPGWRSPGRGARESMEGCAPAGHVLENCCGDEARTDPSTAPTSESAPAGRILEHYSVPRPRTTPPPGRAALLSRRA